MMISLHVRLRYEVPVEVEVNQDILPSVVVDPGHGELVGMASLVVGGVAWLHLGLWKNLDGVEVNMDNR